MSLLDLRMLIETSSEITIMHFLFKSQVYSSVKPEKRIPYVSRAEEQVVH